LFITRSFDQYANPESGFLTIDVHRAPRGSGRRPAAQSLPWLSAGGGRRNCGNLKKEQTMLTIVLIYMLGFLVVVATVLAAMIKTVAHPNR
jgi:hypothetical protein